jgi:hypothetical protein
MWSRWICKPKTVCSCKGYVFVCVYVYVSMFVLRDRWIDDRDWKITLSYTRSLWLIHESDNEHN